MIEKIYFLSEFLFTAVKIMLSLKLIDVIAEPKWDEWLERIVQWVFVIIVTAANTYNNSLGAGIFSNGLLFLIVCFISILAKVLYKIKMGDVFTLLFCLWALFTLFDFFFLSILYLVLDGFGFSTGVFVEASYHRAVYLLFFAVGILVIWRMLHNWVEKYKLIIQSVLKKLNYWSLPLVILLGFCIIYFQRVYKLLITDRYITSWFVFFISSVGLGIALLLYRAMNKEKEKDALQQMKVQMLERNYIALLKNQEEKGILLHDMKNHMVMLSDMIEADEKEKALEYINQICNGLKKGNKQTWTKHAMLDLILNAKIQEAQAEEIDLQIECDDLSDMILPPIDICALFSNLLDNAIEANLKQKKINSRWIHLSCKRQRYMLVVSLSNPTEEQIDSRDGIPETTKKEKVYHGFGMRSIKKVLDKYSGSIKFTTLNGDFKMILGLVGFDTAQKPIIDEK